MVIKVVGSCCKKNKFKINLRGVDFADRCCVIHIDGRADRTFERHIVQRMLGTQNGKIPLSRQQEDRKEYYAWLSSNFIIPPTRTPEYRAFVFQVLDDFYTAMTVLK